MDDALADKLYGRNRIVGSIDYRIYGVLRDIHNISNRILNCGYDVVDKKELFACRSSCHLSRDLFRDFLDSCPKIIDAGIVSTHGPLLLSGVRTTTWDA